MSKLMNKGGFGCIYYPGFDSKDPTNTNNETVVKIQKVSLTAQNEILISNIVKSIPNYLFYFAPIIKTDKLQVNKIKHSLLKECKMLTKEVDKRYMLMTIPYVNQENYFESLTNRVENDTRRILVQFIDSYTFLLKSIELLIDKKIVHMDIKDDNVVYNRLYKNPIIIDFGISIMIDKKQWETMFYVYAPEYYIWCLEIHIIAFILHESSILTKEHVESVCKTYVNKNPVFSYFSSDFKELYTQGAIQYYEKYIQKEKKEIITELLQFWTTWDNYALTLLNIRYVSYMFSSKYNVNNFTKKLSELLLTNIHYNPNHRLSVIDTRYAIKQLSEQDMDINEYIQMREQMYKTDGNIKSKVKKEFISRSEKR